MGKEALRFILLMPLSILSKKGFIDSRPGRAERLSFLSSREKWRLQEKIVPWRWRARRSSSLPTGISFQNLFFFMKARMTASLNGMTPEIHSTSALSAEDTFPLNSRITKLSWLTAGAGSMNSLMAMSGLPTFLIATGGLIIMGDGSGILFRAGHGFPTNLGDGAFTTMADGTGG
jgi:hypothetical protein